jgi:L-aminopeptidase/D-esterase-like protein
MPDALSHTPAGRPRARSLGVLFAGRPGPWNAITDVPGLELGYATLIEGTDVRTGVTAIHPRGRADPADPWVAGFHSQNGNGEMTGLAWIAESGTAAGPVCLTNTHAVGVAHAAIHRWTVLRHPEVADAWLLPVATETWDGYLNDINGGHVTEDTGGGTGMNCYDFKGGSGTASRLVEHAGETYVVGVFVQANFGDREELTIAGVPVGRDLADDNPLAAFFAPPASGSVVAIVATDAPLLPHQCAALARRVTTGIARTGTAGSHFSGDLFLALSTGNPGAFPSNHATLHGAGADRVAALRFVPWGAIDPFFAAVVQGTEEAVLNALVANEEMTGFAGHRTPALPRDRVVELLAARSVR